VRPHNYKEKIMNHKFLIVGFTALSLAAAAQSQSTDKKSEPANTSQVQSPRDSSTGQASGRLHKDGVVHRDLAAREASSGQASGKTMAQDDWHQQKAVSTGNSATVKPVAAGDVDGDGVADQAASKNSAHATEKLDATTNKDVKSPRDVSTGMASGKRQHQPVRITKEVGPATKQ
jgi:hypothetical protein